MSVSALSYKAIFISDVHLGMAGIHANELLEFLENVNADQIFILGDMVDELRLVRKSSPDLKPAHMDVLHALAEKEMQGTEVRYYAGNHERSAGKSGDLPTEDIFTDPGGRVFHIRHGETFGPFLAEPSEVTLTIGLKVHEYLIAANNLIDRASQVALRKHFSSVAALRKKAEAVFKMVGKFEHMAVTSVSSREVDGIICGHIHYPALKNSGGKIYANSGDWVEHCAVLAVTHDGRWEQFDWREKRRNLALKAERTSIRPKSRQNAQALLKKVLGR